MADAIGVVAGLLQIFSFYANLFGAPPAGDTSVGIGIGYATNPDTTQFEGPGAIGSNGASVQGYDEQSAKTFDASFGGLSAGQFVTTTGKANGKDSPFIEFDIGGWGGTVCLAWISVAYPSNAKYAFLAGDIFQYCNVGENPVEWYYSAKDAGQLKDGASTPYYPQCAWLDFKHPAGHRFTGFGVNMPDFAGQNVNAGQALCRPPVLTLYQDFTEYGCPPNNQGCAGKREVQGEIRRGRREVIDADRSLVMSDVWSHNATELCTSGTSRGPDFISYAEGMHCDMQTRTLTPLCLDDGTDSEGCFRVDHQQKLGKREIGGATLTKGYSRIVDWRK